MKHQPDTRHWLDKGRYCYPLSIAVCMVIYLVLAGCATSPPREAYVYWPDNPCSDKQITRVKFFNTWTPVVGCVQRLVSVDAYADASKFVLLTLIGMPPLACTLWDTKGSSYAEIYAPMAGNEAAQTISMILSAGNARPEVVLVDELSHAVGDDHGKCRNGAEAAARIR